MEYIYPDVGIFAEAVDYGGLVGIRHIVILTTWVRKKHGRKWYLSCVMHKEQSHEPIKCTPEMLNAFHAEVYKWLILGKIDTKLIYDKDRLNIFPLDKNQLSEVERLKQKYKL